MRGRSARGCVLERKPRKEFSRDKRLRGGSGKAPSGHSGKNDYTKLEKLWYAGEIEREREEKGMHIVAETKQQFLAMSPLRAHLSWNRFRWDIFAMSNCWLSLGVPKGSRTVNWVGESPNYIPCKHETNRDTFDDRTNDSVAITDAGCRIDEGFEGRGAVERSRNRGDDTGYKPRHMECKVQSSLVVKKTYVFTLDLLGGPNFMVLREATGYVSRSTRSRT
ncbi:hypothetical protein ALC57_00955 [Trachymyrmex cornetzi]|uniref:Uncharacterized protein n=1 Tax=Trachymyrmex cornetzi TaxID=471704 RepID=A0A195EP77_9HYME|nr:hypothetical protein ALC57_00955 [Trachymyrmex cornetzi]